MRTPLRWLAVLLAVCLIPLGQADGHGDWHIDDRPDDVEVRPGIAAAAPPLLDLRKLTIEREDEAELVFLLEVAELQTTSSSAFDLSANFRIAFALPASAARYEIRHAAFATASGSDLRSYAVHENCWAGLDVSTESFTGYHNVPCDYQPASKSIRYRVPKSALHNEGSFFVNPTTEDRRIAFAVGAVLSEFYATATGSRAVAHASAVQITFEDHFPEEGPSDKTYAIRKASANVGLKVLTGFGSRAYAPGYNQTFPFVVQNAAATKRLVRMEYALVEPKDAEDGFKVHGPPVVSVPAGQTRNFTFSFESPPGRHAPVFVRIKGTSIGAPEVGWSELRMVNGTFLAPEANKLYLLNRVTERGPASCLVYSCWDQTLLSPTPTVQGYTDSGRVPLESTDFAFAAHYSPALGYPTIVSQGGRLHVEVNLAARKADIPDATVRVAVAAQGSGFSSGFGTTTLMDVTKEGVVRAEGSVWTFTSAPRAKATTLPEGTVLTLQVNVDYEHPPGARWIQQPELLMEKTHIVLPLEAVPDVFIKNQLPSPFQVGVQGDRDEFVNPGATRLFNVTVLNYDAVEQRVVLDAHASLPWSVQVLPGTEFELPAGQAVTVGVLVQPPADATEGETAFVVVNATSDNGAKVGVRLSASIATQIELRDDTGRFQADKEDLAYQVKPPGKTPGPAMLLALLGLAVAMAGMRRRL